MTPYETLKSIFRSFDLTEESSQLGSFKFNEHAYWRQEVLDESLAFKQGLGDIYVVDEHIYLLETESLPNLKELKKEVHQNIKEIAKPNKSHRNTDLSFFIIVDSLTDEEKKEIQSFKYRKSFLLEFHGTAHVRLIVWSIKDNDIYTSNNAKDFIKKHKADLIK